MAEYMYGVREDGRVVSINDLEDVEIGLRCKCKCPQCKRDLQACSLTSKKVTRYFRHNNEGYNREGIDSLNGCTATSANESGLHMMAKEIIAETRKVAFPAMRISLDWFQLDFSEDTLSQLPQNIPLQSEFIFDCNEVVEIEKPYPQFRPDVSVAGNGQTFLIEIAVTHRVDADKLARVENYGLPMLEIDLSDYVDAGIKREDLRKLISEGFEHKKWISFSNDAVADIRKDLIEKACAIQKRKEELQKQRNEYFMPNIYASVLSVNRDDAAFDYYAKRILHFDASCDQYPFFIDIPISGEIVFTCDRRVWQGKLFDRWVYYRNSDAINIWSIWEGLTKENHIPYNPVLVGKFLYPGVKEASYLPYEVIRKYLDYLEALGFIEIDGKWANVLEKQSVSSPNQEYADQLEMVIRQVDGYSPVSTSLIDQKMKAFILAEQERKLAIEREQARIKIERIKEEQRLKEEAKKQADEEAQQKRLEAIREAIANANYEQKDELIIVENQRWVLCTRCNQPRKEQDMPMIGFDPTRNPNKGVCRYCLMGSG